MPPASGSVWAEQPLAEVPDPRVHVDQVLEDEFPLSIFYSSLRTKMQPVLERPARPRRGAGAAPATLVA